MDPLLSISLILVVIIILLISKLNMNYALLAGIILTSFLFNRGLNTFQDLFSTLMNLSNLIQILMFILIFFLARLMQETGILKKMLISLERIVKHTGTVLLSVPFLIGLVPSPSGAILSAPFVKEMGEKNKISKERQLLINYWFRHITEYLNPIYPGPVLAVGIVGITLGTLFYINWPIVLSVFTIGVLFFILGIKQKELHEKSSRSDIYCIVNGILPIAIAILLPILFKVDLIVSLIAAILATILMNKLHFKHIPKMLYQSMKWDLILLVILVFFFKEVLTNSNAIGQIAASFIELRFPVLLLIIFIPMLIGFLTGMTLAYVGLGFPILLPFFNSGGNLHLGLVMLAYVSGYFGIMVSPLHLCLSATQKYFDVNYGKIFLNLVIPQLLVLGIALALYFMGWPF